MPRFAVYCRVSDEGQLDNSSLASQERLALEWGGSQGWTHVETIRDQGSRDTLERSHTKRLFQLMEDGEIDTVVLYKVDRAGGESEVFSRLFGAIYSAGATVAIVEKRRHYESLMDLMHETVFDRAVSEYELYSIRKRTSQGTIDHLERGSFLTVPLYGYSLTREMRDGVNINVPIVDNERAKIIRHIIKSIAGGKAIIEVGRELNAKGIPGPKSGQWNETTLRNIVGAYGDKYAGQPWTYSRTINKTKKMSVTYEYPAIVPVEDVIAARRSLKTRGNGKVKGLPFRGTITCAHCGKGAAVRWISGKRKHLTTVCNSYTTTHAYKSRGLPVDFKMCPHFLSLRLIKERLIEWLNGEGEHSLDRAVQELQTRLISMRLFTEKQDKRFKQAEKDKNSLVEKLLDSDGDNYKSLRDAINDRLQQADETMGESQGFIASAKRDEQRLVTIMERLGIVPVDSDKHTTFQQLTGEASTVSFTFHAKVGELLDAIERQSSKDINKQMQELGLRISADYNETSKEKRAESIQIELDPAELAGLSQQAYVPFDVPSTTPE